MLNPGSRQQGFVLVTTLALIVVLVLLASAIAAMTGQMLDAARQQEEELQTALDIQNSKASLLYLLSSQRMTFAGLTTDERVVFSSDEKVSAHDDAEDMSFLPTGTEIHMDGTWYEGMGNSIFSLQDDRGLLSPNWTPPIFINRFFEQQGVAQRDWEGLRAKLLDYQDADDLYRLNGGEQEQYRDAGLPPPANHALHTPLELHHVLGWHDLLRDFTDARLLGTFTVSRSAVLNVNSAPEPVLMTIPGMTTAMARRIIDFRRLTPITGFGELVQLAPAASAFNEFLMLYPGPSGSLVLLPRKGGIGEVVHYTMTPVDDGGRPWRIEYRVAIPAEDIKKNEDAVPRRPKAKVFSQPVSENP